MANKIILKKSSVVGRIPTTSDLEYGEVAINYADGKLYYKKSNNTIDSIGGAVSANFTQIDRQSYTASNNQTTFNITYTPPYVDVYVNGVHLSDEDYTSTSGSTVVLTEACSAGDQVDLIGFSAGLIMPGTKTNGDVLIYNSALAAWEHNPQSALTAGNANKWTTARTLSFTGDATGSMSVDGSANVSAALTLANSGVTVGSYGSSTAVPALTVDVKGRVTGITTNAVDGVSSISFNSTTGVLTVSTPAGSNYTADLGIGSGDSPTFNALTTTGNVTIGGNLTINGTTTTINSTTLSVDDLNITVADGAANATAANGAGLTVAGANATITYTSADDRWNFNKDLNVGTIVGTGALSMNSYAAVGAIVANDPGANYYSWNNRIGGGLAVVGTTYLNGNVGVGEVSPTTRLYVADKSDPIANNATKILLTLDHYPATVTPAAGFGVGIEFRGKNPGDGASIYGSIEGVWEGGNTNPSGGALVFKTDGYIGGNTERLRINSEGKVGIGTDNPTRKLHINGGSDAAVGIFITKTGQSGTDIEQSASDFRLQVRDNIPLLFLTNNVERLRITAGGSAGLGENNPAGWGTVFAIKNTTLDSGITLEGNSRKWGIGAGYSANGGAFRIYDFTASADRLFIDSSGNVGIGITSLSQKLQVEGSAAFTGNATLGNSQIQVGFTAPEGHIKSKNSAGAPASNLGLYTTDNSGNTNKIVHISFDGLVGIGTASPGFKLDVNGSARLRGGSLYVGEADTASGHINSYELMTFNIDSDNDDANNRYFGWFKNGADGSGTSMMRLTESGNLGVGVDAPAEKLEVNGKVKHTGLVPTDGTEIDQIKTITKSLTLTTGWIDTGIKANDLSLGTYIIQLLADDAAVGGGHYSEYYSGMMSWYSDNTNDTQADEIVLHRAGHAPNNGIIYLRTLRTLSADTDNLKLQISSSVNTSGASNYVFKFRRMI